MAEFHPVCRVGDVAEGEGVACPVNGKVVAVFCQQGQFYASLASGHLENGVVTCPWHAWRFRVSDGTWADNPRIKIGSYPVRVEGDEIQVLIEPPLAAPKPRES